MRPCEQACGVKAIGSDEQGRASILDDKCVSCGMCMVSCPFGAISDKSQIFQLAHALRDGDKIVAIVAPAYIGQFGDDVTPGKFKTALQVLGFLMFMRLRLVRMSVRSLRHIIMHMRLQQEIFRSF